MLAAANGNTDSEFDLTLFDILYHLFLFVRFLFSSISFSLAKVLILVFGRTEGKISALTEN